MFEPFSTSYYLGRLYVEPYAGDRAVMHAEHHEQVTEQLYDEYVGPLVMKIGTAHVPVHGADDVPGRTVALPEGALSTAGVENPPTLREVLLAKADRAGQLLGLSGEAAPSDSERAAGF